MRDSSCRDTLDAPSSDPSRAIRPDAGTASLRPSAHRQVGQPATDQMSRAAYPNGCSISVDEVDRLFGDRAVDDAIATQLGALTLERNDHVVPAGIGGLSNIGRAWIWL